MSESRTLGTNRIVAFDLPAASRHDPPLWPAIVFPAAGIGLCVYGWLLSRVAPVAAATFGEAIVEFGDV